MSDSPQPSSHASSSSSGQDSGATDQNVSGPSATGYNFRQFSGNFYAGKVQLSASQFFSPDLDEFGPDAWVEPLAAQSLAKHLSSNRVLFLSGTLRDKDDCALHIARLFRERHREEGIEFNCRVLVPSSDPVPLEQELTERKPALLVLRDISPRQILGQEIKGLPSLLERLRGYAIITTSSRKGDWLPEGENQLSETWYDLAWENYYGAESLSEYLVAQIRRRSSGRQGNYLEETVNPQALANGQPLHQVVGALQGPRAVVEFSQFLTSREDLPPKKSIDERLRAVSEDSLAILHWVRQLEPGQRTFLLGLCLMDGLPEDVLFEGLEELVSSCWRKADPFLKQYEYEDLSPFSLYFKQVHSEEDLTRIESVSPIIKKGVIQALWRLHRRHFIASMSTIAALVRESAATEKDESPEPSSQVPAKEAPNDKAESSQEPQALALASRQSDQLHRALIEGLRLFGELSPKAVNPLFFRLAQDMDGNVRRFVARTLAAWIAHGDGDRVSALLTQWWNHARLLPQRRIDAKGLIQGERNPSHRMRATIAQAIAFAAPLYRTNQLPAPLVHIFLGLLNDSSKLVQESVGLALIPYVLEHHLGQVGSLVLANAQFSQRLVLPLALGAARAIASRPSEGEAAMQEWKDRAQGMPSSRSRLVAGERERLLATYATAFGFVALTSTPAALSLDTVYDKFRTLLLEEWHPHVRTHVFSAMELQAGKHFDAVSRLLVEVIAKVQLGERRNVTEVLTRIYLEQRKRLSGGPASAVVDEDLYSLWPNGSRPMTGVERTMMDWSLDSSHPVAQQIAMEAFVAFGESTLERVERQHRHVPVTEEQASPIQAPWSPHLGNDLFELPMLGSAVLSLVTFRNRPVRESASAVLAEWLAIARDEARVPTGSIADGLDRFGLITPANRLSYLRWRLQGNPNLGADGVFKILSSAVGLYRYRWLPFFLAAALVVWLMNR